MKARNPQF